jgi:ABC-type amino acid transport system permease subunit
LAVITVVELFRTAQQIFNENFRAIEVLLGAAVIYFLINFTASKVAAALARRNTVKLA